MSARPRRHHAGLYGVVGVLALWWLGMTLWGGKLLVYNSSESLPRGWYLRALSNRELRHGDLVVFESPETWKKYLPAQTKTTRILKRIAAIHKDTVCWFEREGMHVMSLTQPWHRYALHAEVTAPVWTTDECVTLAHHELAVVGTHARSFDSRYLGPITRDLVQYRVVPLWVWEAK